MNKYLYFQVTNFVCCLFQHPLFFVDASYYFKNNSPLVPLDMTSACADSLCQLIRAKNNNSSSSLPWTVIVDLVFPLWHFRWSTLDNLLSMVPLWLTKLRFVILLTLSLTCIRPTWLENFANNNVWLNSIHPCIYWWLYGSNCI